jgi:hypothetical protein
VSAREHGTEGMNARESGELVTTPAEARAAS